MDIPTWIKPAFAGAAFGAIAMVIFGFSWGGWVTSGTARNISASDLSSGVALALTPYCIERSKSDPTAEKILAEIKASSVYGRRSIVEKSGWATPLGTENPNAALAESCVAELVKTL